MQRGFIGIKLSTGEQVLTKTGRVTSPFPKIDVSTNRKATNTVNRVDQWLIQNAIDEAIPRKDEYNQLIFSNYKPITQADKDCAEE